MLINSAMMPAYTGRDRSNSAGAKRQRRQRITLAKAFPNFRAIVMASAKTQALLNPRAG
jgi:hypothetical protein